MIRYNNAAYIYALCEPSGEIRYIGKTSVKNPKKRLTRHVYDSCVRKCRTYCGNWIRSLAENRTVPVMKILEICEKSLANEREIAYILLFKNMGSRLTNLTNGGDGMSGYRHTDESKLKISIGNKGKNAGKHLLEETKEKIRISTTGSNNHFYGKTHKPDTSQKMSLALIGNKRFLGKKHSGESRDRMRIAKIGRSLTREHRKKLSAIRKGKKLSQETREKMIVAARYRSRNSEGRFDVGSDNKK